MSNELRWGSEEWFSKEVGDWGSCLTLLFLLNASAETVAQMGSPVPWAHLPASKFLRHWQGLNPGRLFWVT